MPFCQHSKVGKICPFFSVFWSALLHRRTAAGAATVLCWKKPEWCAWNKKVMHFNSLFIVCYRLQECVLRQLFPLYIDDDEETAFQTRRKNGNFSHNNVCLFHFFKSRRHALLFFPSFKSLAQCLFLRGFPSKMFQFRNAELSKEFIYGGFCPVGFLMSWTFWTWSSSLLFVTQFSAIIYTKTTPQKYLKMILLECSRCETYRNIVYIKITRNTRFSFSFLYFGAY